MEIDHVLLDKHLQVPPDDITSSKQQLQQIEVTSLMKVKESEIFKETKRKQKGLG